MSSIPDAAARGHLLFLALCVLLTGLTVGFTFSAAGGNEVTFIDLLGQCVILFVLLLFTYQGSRPARWLTSAWLLLLGFGCLGLGLDSGSMLSLTLALGYLATAAALPSLPPLRSWYRYQRTSRQDRHTATRTAVNAAAYPSLLQRVQATFIDLFLLLSAVVLLASSLKSVGVAPLALKLVLVLLVVSYEPLLTVYSATVGQRLVGIRVRRHGSRQRPLSLPQAYLRSAVKLLLGWLSYLTLHTNPEKRAMHDLLARSIMLRQGYPGSAVAELPAAAEPA